MKKEIYDRLIKEHTNMIDKTYQQEIFKRWSDNLNEHEWNHRIDCEPQRDRPGSQEMDLETLRQLMDAIKSKPTTSAPEPKIETREEMEEDDDVSPILAEMINDQ